MSPVPRGRKATFAAVLAVAAVAAAGCGEAVVDASKAGDTIQASLEKSLHEKITSVECPSDQKVEAGQTFTCEVDFSNGKQATATLKIRDKEADLNIVGLKPSK